MCAVNDTISATTLIQWASWCDTADTIDKPCIELTCVLQVRVVQGHEPEHFLRMFKGRMIIFSGGHASGFKNLRDHDTYDVDGTRMFHVMGTSDVDVRAVQVRPMQTEPERLDPRVTLPIHHTKRKMFAADIMIEWYNDTFALYTYMYVWNMPPDSFRMTNVFPLHLAIYISSGSFTLCVVVVGTYDLITFWHV